MLRKFLKDVVVLIVGKQVEEIADLLYSNKHENEFLVAKKLGLTINQTRNILYKIADQGLVSFVRKKDKRKGWYTYFWKLETLKALEFLRVDLLKKMGEINNQIKSRETKQFFVCEICNIEYNEENALAQDFTCSECGNVFILKDNSSVLRELKKNYNKLQKELEAVDNEINIEKKKIDKRKDRELKRLAKEQKIKRVAKKTVKKSKREIRKLKKKVQRKKIKKEKKPKKINKKKPRKKVQKKIKNKTKKKVSKKKSKKK